MKMEDVLYEDVMLNIFSYFNYNERGRLLCVCKRWNRILSEKSTGKLIAFEHTSPFVGKLLLKNDHWSYTDTLQTHSLEMLFKNNYFLHAFRTISSLVIYGNYFIEKSKRCSLNINFPNLIYLELHNCNYENLDRFQSHTITHLFLNRPCTLARLFTNFPSLRHVELTHLESISKVFNHPFATDLRTLNTENYLDRNDIKKLLRYCPKLENVNLKLTHLHLVYSLTNRLRKLSALTFYTTDCSELSDQDKDDFRAFILTKRSDLIVNYCGVHCDERSISVLFDFIQVKKYHNWSIIETNRLLEIIATYSTETDHLDEYFRMTKHLRLFGDVSLNDHLCLKLKNLKKLLVSRCSPDNFLYLISNLTNLRHLSLNSCFFTKSDYDLIPKHLTQLTELVINSCKLNDFEFIYDLKNLQQIVLLLSRSQSVQSYIEIIENCYYLVILRANVLHAIDRSDELIQTVCRNRTVREKVEKFPNISFKYVMLNPTFLNSIEVTSEVVRKQLNTHTKDC